MTCGVIVHACSFVFTDTDDSDNTLPVTSVNEVLGLVGVSPIGGKRNNRSRSYVKEKITRVEGAIRKAVLFAVGDEAMELQMMMMVQGK